LSKGSWVQRCLQDVSHSLAAPTTITPPPHHHHHHRVTYGDHRQQRREHEVVAGRDDRDVGQAATREAREGKRKAVVFAAQRTRSRPAPRWRTAPSERIQRPSQCPGQRRDGRRLHSVTIYQCTKCYNLSMHDNESCTLRHVLSVVSSGGEVVGVGAACRRGRSRNRRCNAPQETHHNKLACLIHPLLAAQAFHAAASAAPPPQLLGERGRGRGRVEACCGGGGGGVQGCLRTLL
jgi:hypothetical protein